MDNSKKLIVYFTYTNNTKRIAEDIKKKLNCDILEIKPVKPYDTDYDTVVRLEQNNETAKKTPDIEKIDVDLSKYDVVIKDWGENKKYVIRQVIANSILENLFPTIEEVIELGKEYDKEISIL